MNDINKLIEISNDLNRIDILNDLKIIRERLEKKNKEIILPLVGEFSSGKTSLINALTDNKKLETSSKATTATIFEIYFGKSQSYAEVLDGENIEIIENIEEIKNESVSEKKLVRIYDTSTRVPESTILVDTPGLSSSDPRHKLALTSYLPKSDAILLVIDINQQITKSLVDFVETSKLSRKPIYLIINKIDVKTEEEIRTVKEYIAKEIKLSISDIACVSAFQGNMGELYKLFDTIQKNKNQIVENALNERLTSIRKLLSDYTKELLSNLSSNSSLDSIIDEQEFKLKKINDNIDRLIKDADNKIADKAHDCKKTFENQVSDKLETIIANSGRDCDNAVYSTVNQISQIVLNNYGKDIQSILYNLAKDRQSKLDAVPLQILENLDVLDKTQFTFSYNMDLSNLGHKYDKIIGYGIIAAAAAATIYASGGTAILAGGGVVKNKVVKEGGKILLVQTVENTVKSSTEITKNQELMIKAGKLKDNIDNLQNTSQTISNTSRGLIETSVGWITDKFIGKPQRKKAVREYTETYLLPEFTFQLDELKSNLIRSISDLLREEARNSTQQMENELRELLNKKETKKDLYNQQLNKLNEYVKFLN